MLCYDSTMVRYNTSIESDDNAMVRNDDVNGLKGLSPSIRSRSMNAIRDNGMPLSGRGGARATLDRK